MANKNRKFNAQHLGSTKNYQIQQTNWYEIVIPGMNDLTFLTQSATLPELSNPVIEVPYGNSTAKVAGKRDIGSGSFSFMDAMVADAEKQLIKWQNKIYNPRTGKMGWVSDYKKDITVTQYGPDGTYERTWHYEGCWPSSINYGEMSGENADKKVIQVTLEYDNAYREDI